MKEHNYKYKFSKVLLKSIPVWICLAIQMGFSISIVFNEGEINTLIFMNLFLSIFTIPCIIMHRNYLKHTRNRVLTLRYNTISLISGEKEITLNTTDITKVTLHKCPSGFRFPWWNYSWFELIDKEGQNIKVSCYLLNISDFWQDSLSRRVSSKNLVREESLFPLMK
jgi:hypothetical protein